MGTANTSCAPTSKHKHFSEYQSSLFRRPSTVPSPFTPLKNPVKTPHRIKNSPAGMPKFAHATPFHCRKSLNLSQPTTHADPTRCPISAIANASRYALTTRGSVVVLRIKSAKSARSRSRLPNWRVRMWIGGVKVPAAAGSEGKGVVMGSWEARKLLEALLRGILILKH